VIIPHPAYICNSHHLFVIKLKCIKHL
jgi:hypothetical protein